MLEAADFLDDLAALGVHRFFGVPDSLLAGLISGIEARANDPAHHGACRLEITADEGAAVGLAIGSYLASAQPSVVFMQNSGLGNAINPLTSLTSPKVYGIPMLMLIGWRGEMTETGQIKDEPQHVFQGEITCTMLDLLDIPYRVIGPDDARDAISQAASDMLSTATAQAKPTALVIRKATFAEPGKAAKPVSAFPTREGAVRTAMTHLGKTPIVATTGKISREVYEVQRAEGIGGPTFLTVGGMGHAVMIATGAAFSAPKRKIACFDGDGAVLMHTGSLATSAKCPNLIHLVFNNQVHDSVGGQPTAAPDTNLTELAAAFGYCFAKRVQTTNDLSEAIKAALDGDHASFIEIMVAPGSRADLGRPQEPPAVSKAAFMTAIGPLND